MRKKLFLYIFSFFFISMFYQNCAPPSHTQGFNVEQASINSFEDINEKVISTKCVSCHSAGNPSGGVDLSSYEAILASGTVVPGNSEASSLYKEVTSRSMPIGGSLTSIEIAAIGEWIDGGAKNSTGVEANKIPVVNAGEDLEFELPILNVSITATASDPDGSIMLVGWTQLSGPNMATLSGVNSLNLTVSDLAVGVYTFQLEVKDDQGALSSDIVTLSITEKPNALPMVNAGSDKIIILPETEVTITGTASDQDGSVIAVEWSQVNGPLNARIDSPNSLETRIKDLDNTGTYEFMLKVTDDQNGISFDNVKVIVNDANNNLPIANAGNDITIKLPTNSVTINGSGTDSDGSIIAYQWKQVSGPSSASLSGQNGNVLTASNLTEGNYTFQLSVTDNKNAMGTDSVNVMVGAGVSVPTFSELNQTIFGPKCISCHSGSNPRGDYGMDSYQAIMSAVVKGNANKSSLYLIVLDNSMPRGGSPLSSEEKTKIREWINAGAINN